MECSTVFLLFLSVARQGTLDINILHLSTEPKVEAIDRKAGEAMQEFKDVVFPDDYNPAGKPAAKRKVTQKPSSQYWGIWASEGKVIIWGPMQTPAEVSSPNTAFLQVPSFLPPTYKLNILVNQRNS